MKTNITKVRHPYYSSRSIEWDKWRLTYEGGPDFITRYLKKFSRRESTGDFARRKEITYNPAFARSAIDEIKNAIFQRMVDIARKGGPDSYTKAMKGEDGGVDQVGSSMNAFLGRDVLPELLTMSRVGIFVDMPRDVGVTAAEAMGKRPYLYTYRTEDILSWCFLEGSKNMEYKTILLRDYIFDYDEETGLPIGESCKYRRLWINEHGTVSCCMYNYEGEEDEVVETTLTRIPFHIVEISNSLLMDVANYQIALLNLASSDMAYSLHSNYPFYTEQFDPRMEAAGKMNRPAGNGQGGESADAAAGKTEEVKVGAGAGRRYPTGSERPGFIHPSSEPLEVSMKKQQQLKDEIRLLVNLTVTNLQPVSAESKGFDQLSLENGLSYIGLELENAERCIARLWTMYTGGTPATVHYPEDYSLKTDEDRVDEAEKLKKLLPSVPSATFQKAVGKRIAKILVGSKVSHEDWEKIAKEIDKSTTMNSDPDVISKDLENGLVDLETASKLRGYPDGSVEKAKKDHADRVARIAKAQTPPEQRDAGARGVSDLADNPQAGAKGEKKQVDDQTMNDQVKDQERGDGKKLDKKTDQDTLDKQKEK